MSDGYTSPPRRVVLIRSTFVGLMAGGLIGAGFGAVLSIATSEQLQDLLGALWAGFVVGGVIGLATGLMMGLALWLLGPTYQPRSQILRLGIALGTVTCGFVALSMLAGRPLVDLYALILLAPAGLAAWFLLPVVLRPTPR
jgi:hypothetical protein